eukprot:2863-Eustigmatos_ZCMA.PRE.1
MENAMVQACDVWKQHQCQGQQLSLRKVNPPQLNFRQCLRRGRGRVDNSNTRAALCLVHGVPE